MEALLQGICVDSKDTTTLAENKTYFLFSGGPDHYYVSRFPKQKAHMGCYRSNRFKLIEKEQWPTEPDEIIPNLEIGKMYKAQLVWRKEGYRSTELKEYYVIPRKTTGFFYDDPQKQGFGGCFPLHWFTNFEEVGLPPIETKIIEDETEPEILEQLSLDLF